MTEVVLLKVQEDEKVGSIETKLSCWRKIAGIGFLLIILKNLISGFGDILVKSLTEVHPITLIFLRSVTTLTMITPVGIVRDQPPFPAGHSLQDRALLVARCLIGCVQVSAGYFALQQMPVGIQKMISSCKPVFTIVFARLFLKERLSVASIAAVLLMLAGVLAAVQPWYHPTNPEDGYRQDFVLASILFFCSTALASNITIILRKFKDKDVTSLSSSRELIYTIVPYVVVMLLGLELPSLNWSKRLRLVGLASVSLLVSNLNILALKMEEASRVAPFDRCSALLVSFTSQIFIFNESPSLSVWAGLGFVLLATLLLAMAKLCDKTKQKEGEEKEKNNDEKEQMTK